MSGLTTSKSEFNSSGSVSSSLLEVCSADVAPVAKELKQGEGTAWKTNFTGWWAQWRDDVITRDIEWIRSVNPNGYTVEKWMRENNYTGKLDRKLLKNMEVPTSNGIRPKFALWVKY